MDTSINNKNIPLNERLILALDVETLDEAKRWVENLEGKVFFYKVGLQLFLSSTYDIIDWITGRDCKVFVDLKFFDVPATIKHAVEQLKKKKISFASVHGNENMIKAACEVKNGVKILAVTVLTSLDDNDMKDLGFQCSTSDLVLSRAKRCLEAGCDGIISSGLETPHLRNQFGNQFIIVNPGIRPVTNDEENKDDQKRTVDAYTAFKNGADYIVVGRPIRNAIDPIEMVDKIFLDIDRALKERNAG